MAFENLMIFFKLLFYNEGRYAVGEPETGYLDFSSPFTHTRVDLFLAIPEKDMAFMTYF